MKCVANIYDVKSKTGDTTKYNRRPELARVLVSGFGYAFTGFGYQFYLIMRPVFL